MNLLQIKQKMFELGISESYLADCCGVGKNYLKTCLSACKSHPMTKKLEQKIEGVFHNLEIKKAKEAKATMKIMDSDAHFPQPEPKPFKPVIYNPILDVAKALFGSYGYCSQTTSFDLDDAWVTVSIDIKRVIK